MNKTRVLVFMAFFIALEIILTRFLSFQTSFLRIGFGFLPVALAAALLGPVFGGLTAALADILRMFIFPSGFPYFPGFTLTALVSGAIYGLILYKKPKSYVRVGLAVLLTTLVADLGLNTLWLSVFMGNAISAIFLPRLITAAVMFPVKVILIHTVWRYVGSVAERNFPTTK